jgi:two-component system response regulator MprA
VRTVPPPTVGVCEDDTELRDILRGALEREGFTVFTAASGRGAVEAFSSRPFQAIVLDIGLPDADGRDVCQALRAAGVMSPILFLTAREVLADRLSGFHAGGDDYLTKPFAISELLVRINALIRRASNTEMRAELVPMVLDPALHAIVTGDRRVALTPTEFRLLGALAARKGVVIRRSELMAAGWPEGAIVSANTLDSYLARIRQKLRAARVPAAIETIRGVGYSFR